MNPSRSIPFPTILPAVRFLASGAMVLSLEGSEPARVAIDQPERWYDLSASHHSEHALGGLVIGALGYEAAAIVTDHRDRRIATAVALGVVAGVAFEVARGQDGSSYIDPIDAAYVAAGSLIGACLADEANLGVSVVLSHRVAAIEVAWRF